MRSEFEKYFKENHADSFYSVDAALEMRGNDYIDFHAADLWALWQHQQSKVDELQKRVDAALIVAQSIRKEIEHGHLSDDESQTLSSYADDLEQALKGGSDASN